MLTGADAADGCVCVCVCVLSLNMSLNQSLRLMQPMCLER